MKPPEPVILNWHEIAAAPEAAGIYAWYFKPELTDYDIDSLVAELNENEGKSSETYCRDLVRRFLKKRIFRYFEQKPYLVELSGQLKPRYRGEIEHQPDLDLSDVLIDRILKDPSRLNKLKVPLSITTPMFASPLYIGMADRLRTRLASHKKLISSLENSDFYNSTFFADYELSLSEKNFAERVKAREIPSSRLFVVAQVISPPSDPNDVENILNRIYFPVLGRN